VARTGQVGVVAVAGWERFKGGSRVSFVCGGRALRSHGALRDIVAGATRTLSVAAADIAPTLERLQAEVREAARTVKRLEDELAGYQAVSFRAGAETIGACRGVLKVIAGRDAAALKTIGQAIVSEPGFVVVLVGDGQPAPVVIVRSADVHDRCGRVDEGATAALGGRGGGRPEAAQGGSRSRAGSGGGVCEKNAC
jgi:alanyl-tRNA synthetase